MIGLFGFVKSTRIEERPKFHQYACADIPEFEALRSQSVIKESLLQEAGTENAFIERAAETLHINLMYAPSFAPHGAPSLLKRLQRNYEPIEISRALARAWLDDAESFELPAENRQTRQQQRIRLMLLSFFLAISSLIALIFYGRGHFLELTLELLVASPLLFGLGTVLFYLYYNLLKRMRGVSEGTRSEK